MFVFECEFKIAFEFEFGLCVFEFELSVYEMEFAFEFCVFEFVPTSSKSVNR